MAQQVESLNFLLKNTSNTSSEEQNLLGSKFIFDHCASISLSLSLTVLLQILNNLMRHTMTYMDVCITLACYQGDTIAENKKRICNLPTTISIGK